ncbi:MAG: type II secretion system protein N [Gammaproteobacteria bacterium]
MALLSYVKRVSPWLPIATLGLAGVVVLYSLTGFFHVLTGNPTASTMGLSHSAPRAMAPTADMTTLFGKTPDLLKVAEGGLSLRGIFMSATPEAGSAIIGLKGQKPKLYIVGDKLPNGTTLVAVHEQQVVLEKSGEQSMLSLPQTRL